MLYTNRQLKDYLSSEEDLKECLLPRNVTGVHYGCYRTDDSNMRAGSIGLQLQLHAQLIRGREKKCNLRVCFVLLLPSPIARAVHSAIVLVDSLLRGPLYSAKL